MSQELKEARTKMTREWVMSTEQGRQFLWELMSFCGIYQDIEGEGTIAFKQIGRRQVGLHLLGILSDTSSELVFKMMKEAEARTTQENLNAGRKRDTENRNDDYTDRYFKSASDELDSFIGDDSRSGFNSYASGGPAI